MIKVVMIDANEETMRDYAEYFSGKEDYQVLGMTDDGQEGIRLITEHRPDVVVLSMTAKTLDGFGVMDEISRRNITTSVIATGSFGDDDMIGRIIGKGAKYYMLRPVSPEILDRRIQDTIRENKSVLGDLREKKASVSLDERISNIFISIGIPPHIKGYAYLREGIKLAIEDPSVINNVTKVLYPHVAEKFETSPSKVERAIRHAIEVAWNRGRVEAINAIFGVRVYIGTEKPTNSEFIALVADKLILEAYRCQ